MQIHGLAFSPLWWQRYVVQFQLQHKRHQCNLVFGRDTILNTKFLADWNYIRQRKQNIIDENNRKENAKRIAHTYQVGDKVLVKQHNQTKYGGPEYDGPYPISAVNANGTVRVRKTNYYDIVNIRNIKPYTDRTEYR